MAVGRRLTRDFPKNQPQESVKAMFSQDHKAFIHKLFNRLKQTARESITHRSFTFPPELREISKLDTALTVITERWPKTRSPDSEHPVFIMSAGWRSGSTLLQRLVCSTSEILIWGEPLGDAAVLPRMASSVSVISKTWPPDSFFGEDMELASFSNRWIANVTPSMESFRLAHRAFMDQWLAHPVRKFHGELLWGMKEVRLTIEHAKYLQWLYPEARFIFLYRDPLKAYFSWRGNAWASPWPGYFTWSPIAYARHWKLLLSGYVDGYQEVNGYLLKYEDLCAGKVDLQKLADFIGIKSMDATVLERRIAAPTDRKKRRRWLTPIERWLIILVAGKLMKRVGYR
jgi:hypothetical protein